MRTNNPHSDPVEPIPIPLRRQTQTNLFTEYSIKAHKILQFESAWEYRFFLLCESNPDIIRLCTQPYQINEKINGKKLNYTFDMWLCWKDGYREYIEVKPEDRCELSESGQLLPPKWPLIETWSDKFSPHVNIRHVSDRYINKHAEIIKKWDKVVRYVHRAEQQDNHDIKGRVEHQLKHRRKCSLQEICIQMLHQNKCHADLIHQSFNKGLVLNYGEATST